MSEEKKKEIRVYYQEGAQYRTVYAGGAWAGVTPQGHIQFALFNDLRAIPDYVTHKITDEGGFGPEIEKSEPQGIMREIEINVIMPPAIAEALVTLIQQMIAQIKALEETKASKSGKKRVKGKQRRAER